jgi:ketosteroid isomerase-like protein
MSQENAETVRRVMDAYNRRDVEAMLVDLDPEIEWHPLLPVLLGGEATVYRGHQGVRNGITELDDAFSDLHAEISEVVREQAARIVAVGRLHGHGRESGAATESPLTWLVEFRNDKVFRVREYVDSSDALEAARLRE